MPARLRGLFRSPINTTVESFSPAQGHVQTEADSPEPSEPARLEQRWPETYAVQNFQHLPRELLDQICEHLTIQEARSFSLCSKHSLYVVLPLLYSRISLDMTRVRFIDETLKPWTQLLHRRCAFESVRTIDIKGRKWTHGPNLRRSISGNAAELRRTGHALPISKSKIIIMNRHYMEDYSLLIEFLRDFPRLTTINLSISDAVPPILLASFQEHHPTCRIHLRDLKYSPNFMTIHDFLDVSKLPNLVSLNIAYHRSELIECEQLLLFKTLDLLTHGAFELRHVELNVKGTWTTDMNWARQALKALNDTVIPDHPRTKLDSLAISQNQLRSRISLDPAPVISNLSRLIDTSCLQILRLSGFLGPDLDWASKNCHFSGLKEVELKMKLEFEDAEMWVEATTAAKSFLSSLPALSTLGLWRIGRPADLIDLLGHHQASLTSLTVFFHRNMHAYTSHYSTVAATDIVQISKHCPLLESLELEVRRDFSSEGERTVYQSFGLLHALQNLTLVMDCTPSEHFDITKKKYLENSVLDETLALSIWNIVTERKIGKALTKLKVYSKTGSRLCNFYQQEINPGPPKYIGLASICRSYELTRTIERNWSCGVCISQVLPPRDLPNDIPEAPDYRLDAWVTGQETIERKAIEDIWKVSIGESGWEKACTSIPFR